MEALRAAELAADRPTRKGPVASSSTGMNGQRTGHGGPAGGEACIWVEADFPNYVPRQGHDGPAGGGRFWRYSNYCYFCELEFKQLNHMKKDIEIGEYSAPECRVILLSLEGNAMQTVSNEGRENDDDDIFG